MEQLLCVNELSDGNKKLVRVYFKKGNLEFTIQVSKFFNIIAESAEIIGDPEIKRGLAGCCVSASRGTMNKILKKLTDEEKKQIG